MSPAARASIVWLALVAAGCGSHGGYRPGEEHVADGTGGHGGWSDTLSASRSAISTSDPFPDDPGPPPAPDCTSGGVARCGLSDDPDGQCVCAHGQTCDGTFCQGEALPCSEGPFFASNTCDECALVACCPEVGTCEEDLDSCFDESGTLDPDTENGRALADCLAAECPNECGVVCGQLLGASDPTVNACLGANCCAEVDACTSGDSDTEGCWECLDQGGGPLCDGFLACFDACRPHVCDTSFTSGHPHLDACLTENCCAEFQACTANGPSACTDCWYQGGGTLCDEAFDCYRANCAG